MICALLLNKHKRFVLRLTGVMLMCLAGCWGSQTTWSAWQRGRQKTSEERGDLRLVFLPDVLTHFLVCVP
jgi:hypothetical protein